MTFAACLCEKCKCGDQIGWPGAVAIVGIAAIVAGMIWLAHKAG